MDKAYTDKTKIEELLKETIDRDLDDIILMVQQYIENKTNRVVSACDKDSARYYEGNGSDNLKIDECIEITKVENGDDYYGDGFTEIPNTGDIRYYTEPYNELPIDTLRLRGELWTPGKKNVRITARWGYSEEPPDDIVWVATYLSAMFYKQQTNVAGGVQSETIGSYSVNYSLEAMISNLDEKNKVMEILKYNKKYEF